VDVGTTSFNELLLEQVLGHSAFHILMGKGVLVPNRYKFHAFDYVLVSSCSTLGAVGPIALSRGSSAAASLEGSTFHACTRP
jgi:hypothetical protein